MQKRLGGGGEDGENDDPESGAAAVGGKQGALEKYSGVKVKVRRGFGGWFAAGAGRCLGKRGAVARAPQRARGLYAGPLPHDSPAPLPAPRCPLAAARR